MRREPAQTEPDRTRHELEVVHSAARRGAAAATRIQQWVSDAAEEAVALWQQRGAESPRIRQLERWAYRVGRNLAKRIAARLRRSVSTSEFEAESTAMLDRTETACRAGDLAPQSDTKHLREHLLLYKSNLTPRQFEVAWISTNPGLSTHKAACALGIDRSNFRRTLQRAVKRLRESGPPPLSRVDLQLCLRGDSCLH